MLKLPENQRDSFLESITKDKEDSSHSFSVKSSPAKNNIFSVKLPKLTKPVPESPTVVVSEKKRHRESIAEPVVSIKRRKESESDEPISVKRKTKTENKSPKKRVPEIQEPGKFPLYVII